FDTVLAVYTGGSLGSLTEVSYDDDGGSGLTSRVQLEVTAGRTYRIVVDGYSDRTGNITLNWSLGATQTDPASSAPTPT
ncbi:MAG: calcium-binding protein, partial [Actinobacteria bacterium]|nr:calcium-binding protein [Actinomycetota bacterium]